MGEPHFHHHLVGLVGFFDPPNDEGNVETSRKETHQKLRRKTEETLREVTMNENDVCFFEGKLPPLRYKKDKTTKNSKKKNVP